MNLNDVFTNVSLLKSLVTIAAVLILGGVYMAALRYGYAKHLAAAFRWWRENVKKIEAAVDESTDDINVQLERATGVSAATWAGILPIIVKALNTGVESVPLAEVAPEPPAA